MSGILEYEGFAFASNMCRVCLDNLSVVVGAPIGFMWGSYLEYEGSAFASNMIGWGLLSEV